MSATAIWAIVAAVALGIEIFTLDLTFGLIAIGALAGAGVSLVGAPLPLSSRQRRSHLQGSCSSDRSHCVTCIACPRGPEPESTLCRGSKAMP